MLSSFQTIISVFSFKYLRRVFIQTSFDSNLESAALYKDPVDFTVNTSTCTVNFTGACRLFTVTITHGRAV